MEIHKKGDLILKSKPFVHVLSQSQRGIRCDECFKRQEGCLRCSACKVARYCSAKCQKKAWAIHKWECKCFCRVVPRIPTESVRLFFHLLVKIQKCDGLNDRETVFGKERNFDDLMSHEEQIKSDPKRLDELLKLTQTLTAFAGDTFTDLTPELVLEYFGRMVINTFSICDGEMQPIGVGLYMGASVLDHSCDPNAVVVFDGSVANVRCLQPIHQTVISPKITISYIDLLATTEQRQCQLSAQYYFTCTCDRCSDTAINEEMVAIQCPKPNCKGLTIHHDEFRTCSQCNAVINDSQEKKRYMTDLAESIETLRKLQKQKEHKPLLAQCMTHLTQAKGTLPDTNIYIIQIYDLMFDACIQLEEWSRAAKCGALVLGGFRKYHSPNHPTIGLHLMKLGKILLYLQQLKDALMYLNQAEDILSVTHSRNHTVTVELRELIAQCTQQLQTHVS